MNTCSNTCETRTESNTTRTAGPERKPTSYGYKFPDLINREQEKAAFQLLYREGRVSYDPFHFYMDGDDLWLQIDNDAVVHLVIEDGYLVLYQTEGSYEEGILAKYRFEIVEDGWLEVDPDPTYFVDPFHFRLEGKNLFLNVGEDEEVHLIIDDDGYLILSPESEGYQEWLLSNYKFKINEDGYLIMSINI